jgi:hypothetical protein
LPTNKQNVLAPLSAALIALPFPPLVLTPHWIHLYIAEYGAKGQVSSRTDAFAYGIIVIELLTGLSPVEVRDLVDDALPEEAPQLIREHHDTTAAQVSRLQAHKSTLVNTNADFGLPLYALGIQPPQMRAAGEGRECVWQPMALQILSTVAARCTFLQQKQRVTISTALPEIEQVVAGLAK